MSGLEGLQQALNKAAEQTAKQGAETQGGPAGDVSQADAQKMRDLLSDINQGINQAEQANQAKMNEVSEVKKTDQVDPSDKADGPKSIGDKILDQLQTQQTKMDDARAKLGDLADKVASGKEVDAGSLFQLQMQVFEIQHMTEAASKAGGQISEDLKKLQSGQ